MHDDHPETLDLPAPPAWTETEVAWAEAWEGAFDAEFYERSEHGFVVDQRTPQAVRDLIPICGCGSPGIAAAVMHEALGTGGDDKPFRRCDALIAFVAAHPRAAAELIHHMLNEAGLLEHGGTVPGWLTEEGERVVEVLNRIAAGARERLARP